MEMLLVSDSTIISNLRRTARKNLISSLSSDELNSLALKYFGISKNGELVGYMCPYSGQILTDTKDIVLEHIIPVSSGGGTTLYNCIPTSTEVNKVSEKGIKNLISWWVNSKYWDEKAPERLEKILQYILEAYSYSFNSERGNDFVEVLIDVDEDSDKYEEDEADLSTTQEEEQEKNQSLEINYYGFIIDIINELKKYTDTSKYEIQLQNLVKQNTFNNVERQALIQNKLKEIIKNKLEVEDRSELSIVLNININLLTKSLEEYSNDKIDDILIARINNIEEILDKNNLSLDSFFNDKNYLIYLYKDKLTEEDINNLIEDINMSVNDKLKDLINSISKNEKLNYTQSNFLILLKTLEIRENKKPRFSLTLTKSQLEILAKSDIPLLQQTYLEILRRSYKYNIYNEQMLIITEENKVTYNEIIQYYNELNLYNAEDIRDLDISHQIYFIKKYKNILQENSFIKLINWLNENPNDVPSRGKAYTKEENEIGKIANTLTQFSGNRNKFQYSLTKKELEYMANSNNQVLLWIYYQRYIKAKKNNINFECNIIPNVVERPRKKNQTFEEMLIWFYNNPGYKLPTILSKDSKEKVIGRFYQNIKTIDPRNKKHFITTLTKNELETLANSQDERLLRLYAEIYNKAKENNIYIATSIEPKVVSTVVNSKFNELLKWIYDNPGLTPSTLSEDDDTKNIAKIYQSIKTLDGHDKKYFQMNLSRDELFVLATSNNELLANLYKEILFKSIKFNIYNENDLIYTDNNRKIVEMYQNYFNEIRNLGVNDLRDLPVDQQFMIVRKYPEIDFDKPIFLKLVEWLQNNDGIPNKEVKKAKTEDETKIGSFWWRITNVMKNSKGLTFKTMLTKEELKYMFNSDDLRLRACYNRILIKAIENEIVINYYPVDILNEIMIKNNSYYNKIISVMEESLDFNLYTSESNQIKRSA